jgi:hypothetical protein
LPGELLSFAVVRDAVHGDPERRSRRCALPHVERLACSEGWDDAGPLGGALERFSWEPPLSRRLTRALHDARLQSNGSSGGNPVEAAGAENDTAWCWEPADGAHRQVDDLTSCWTRVGASGDPRNSDGYLGVPVLGFCSFSNSLFGPFVACLGDRRKFPSWRGQCMVCAAAGADVSSLEAPSIPCRAGQLQWGRRHPACSYSVLGTVTSELFPLWSSRWIWIWIWIWTGREVHPTFISRTTLPTQDHAVPSPVSCPRPEIWESWRTHASTIRDSQLRAVRGSPQAQGAEKGPLGPSASKGSRGHAALAMLFLDMASRPPVPRREIQYREVRFSRPSILDFVKGLGVLRRMMSKLAHMSACLPRRWRARAFAPGGAGCVVVNSS